MVWLVWSPDSLVPIAGMVGMEPGQSSTHRWYGWYGARIVQYPSLVRLVWSPSLVELVWSPDSPVPIAGTVGMEPIAGRVGMEPGWSTSTHRWYGWNGALYSRYSSSRRRTRSGPAVGPTWPGSAH